jgi:malate synthase
MLQSTNLKVEPSTQPACQILGKHPEQQQLLTDGAVEFLSLLHSCFETTRQDLLAERLKRQADFDRGIAPDYLPETISIRQGDWRVAPIPADLQDRRVEITGPVDRKMVINALNSGAKVYMADFEDSHAPTWAATVEGHVNMKHAVDRTISFRSDAGKSYQLNNRTAVLIVRPRGWHMDEKHLLLDDQPISASLFDFGLNIYHTWQRHAAQGTRPYYYLPKMEHYLEARLWAEVFDTAEDVLGMEHGTIRATALIETLPAVFQMDEILYEMRDYIAGLNCGRWDYIFSYIKTFRNHPDKVLPERAQVGMTAPFLRNYSQLLIQTCHRRGAFAMGGMAAQIPIKHDEAANREAFLKVSADKLREVTDGHDGTWVAHPGLIHCAKEIFDDYMPQPNQLNRPVKLHNFTQDDLISPSSGSIGEKGLRNNIEVAIEYLAAWLGGNGCVPIHNLMEDAATAEISRMQIWQWVRHGAQLQDGRIITMAMVRTMISEELGVLTRALADDDERLRLYRDATRLLDEAVSSPVPPDFITQPAYATYD